MKKKILLIVFMFLMILSIGQIAYADEEKTENGKKEGATGTYANNIDLQITKEGGLSSYAYVNYEIQANSNRPIYQYDEINLKIHVRRNLWSGKISGYSKDGYDKEQMELQTDILEVDYSGINEVDFVVKIVPLVSGNVNCTITVKDNAEGEIRIKINGIKPFSDLFEQDRRKEWSSYKEAKVYGNKEQKVAGIIQGRYSETNVDTSTSDKAGEEIYTYTAMSSDTGWQEWNLSKQKTGITHRTIEVECTASKDYGNTIHKGEKYNCKYEFFYISDKNKLIYHYSRERVKTADGNETTDLTGKENSEEFDKILDKTEEARKKYSVFWESTEEVRNKVVFQDVLTNINNYIPADEVSDGRIENKASIILTIITNVGMILAVLMCAIIGVKYMLGSLEEKAEYKKDMIPYLIGAFLLFSITVVVKILQQIGQSINNI